MWLALWFEFGIVSPTLRLLQQSGGIPAVIVGLGSIEQAHKPDEFIEINQIARFESFMQRLLDEVSAG
jgi:acetylornithine deacetylase